MRIMRSLLTVALLAVFVLALGGCGSAASSGGDELTADESAVPAGMPVMYEFFTDT